MDIHNPETETEQKPLTDAEQALFHIKACQMWNTCINNWNKYKTNYKSIYGNDTYRHYHISKPIIFTCDYDDEPDD